MITLEQKRNDNDDDNENRYQTQKLKVIRNTMVISSIVKFCAINVLR